MELDDDTLALMRDTNNLIGDEPGWREVTSDIQLADWYSRALSSAALLTRVAPTLAIGYYKDGRGSVNLFTERVLVTIVVVQVGGETSATTTARPRAGLVSIDLDAPVPAFHSGFSRDWPGRFGAQLTYRDGLVVEFRRNSPSERHARFLAELPRLLADLHHG